ncbi:unnamed protein product [Urochloa humidicola]
MPPHTPGVAAAPLRSPPTLRSVLGCASVQPGRQACRSDLQVRLLRFLYGGGGVRSLSSFASAVEKSSRAGVCGSRLDYHHQHVSGRQSSIWLGTCSTCRNSFAPLIPVFWFLEVSWWERVYDANISCSVLCMALSMEVAKLLSPFGQTSDFGRCWSSDLTWREVESISGPVKAMRYLRFKIQNSHRHRPVRQPRGAPVALSECIKEDSRCLWRGHLPSLAQRPRRRRHLCLLHQKCSLLFFRHRCALNFELFYLSHCLDSFVVAQKLHLHLGWKIPKPCTLALLC